MRLSRIAARSSAEAATTAGGPGSTTQLVLRALGRALPARAGGVDHLGHVERLRRRPLAAAREGEQLGEEPGEPLGLVLGGGQLALDLGIAALQRRRLEPQPQPGQRRAQLVRRVRHELALRRAAWWPCWPVMSLNAVATSRCSVEPSTFARASRSPPRHAPGGAGEAAERAWRASRRGARRPRGRAAAPRAPTPISAITSLRCSVLTASTLCGDPHRADRPPARRDRHGGEEEVLVERGRCGARPGWAGRSSAVRISWRVPYG